MTIAKHISSQNNIFANISYINNELQKLNNKLNLKKSVTLVIVTKGRSIKEIEQAILSGGSNFGENYLQEALLKWNIIKQKYPSVKLHFIGGIQSNKLNKILSVFDVIQSIDSKLLIDKILKFKDIYNKECFIEVKSNGVSNVSNRKGVNLEEAHELINYALQNGLNIKGIMGIASLSDVNDNINYFNQLRNLKESYSLSELSLGMSNDYKLAVEYGSTMVRIGSKIFN